MTKKVILHVLKGAILVGAAAFIGAVVGDVKVLGLDTSQAALLTAGLVALQDYLQEEAKK